MFANPLYSIGRFIIHLSDTSVGRVSLAVLLGLASGGVSIVAHHLTANLDVNEHTVHLANAFVIGLFVALLTYVEITAVRERRSRVVENLRTVAELNHVLRNSLQAIQYAAKLSADDKHVRIINECVSRIDSAVRDLFPVVVDPRRPGRSHAGPR